MGHLRTGSDSSNADPVNVVPCASQRDKRQAERPGHLALSLIWTTKMTAGVNSYRLNLPRIHPHRPSEKFKRVFSKLADVVVMVQLCNIIMTIVVALTGAWVTEALNCSERVSKSSKECHTEDKWQTHFHHRLLANGIVNMSSIPQRWLSWSKGYISGVHVCVTNPWDGEGQAEVLPSLQSEAPGGRASQWDAVAAAHDSPGDRGADILQSLVYEPITGI